LFNTLRYTEDLEKAGFTPEQAKASLRLLIDVMNEEFATKSDLLLTKSDLRSEIQSVRLDMQAMESRLTIRLGSMIAAGVVALGVLIQIH
jgi:hypothetical protein